MPTPTAGEQGCSIIHRIITAATEAQELTVIPAASSGMFSMAATAHPIRKATPAVLLLLLPVPAAVLPAHQEVAAAHR
jgi:hypothetical protein